MLSCAQPISKGLLLAVSTIALAMPASAGRDNPAPIIYSPQGTQPSQSATASANAAQQAQAASGPRVEFRYPDQPDRVYSDGVARASTSDAPIAFSSSQAAISPDAARQYAHIYVPTAGGAGALDPSLTAGSFDARATAERIAAQASLPPHTAPAPAIPTSNSYSLPGQVHSPAPVDTYDESGNAGIYGVEYEGQPTANGETYLGQAMTAAHPTLPLPSLVQVINPANGQEVVVRVNDRGPFAEGRLIDVSSKAADLLGLSSSRDTAVRVRYLGPAPVVSPMRTVSAEAVQPVAAPTVTEVELQPLYTAPPARTPAPVQASFGESGDFYVQLGSFADIGNAQRLVSSLDAALPINIVDARINGGDYFRVWVGPYETRSNAQRTLDDLTRRGVITGFIVDES